MNSAPALFRDKMRRRRAKRRVEVAEGSRFSVRAARVQMVAPLCSFGSANLHPYVAASMAGAHPGQQWK